MRYDVISADKWGQTPLGAPGDPEDDEEEEEEKKKPEEDEDDEENDGEEEEVPWQVVATNATNGVRPH